MEPNESSNEMLPSMVVVTVMEEDSESPKKKIRYRKKKIKSVKIKMKSGKMKIKSGKCIICNRPLSEEKAVLNPTEEGIRALFAAGEVRQDAVFEKLSRNQEGIIAGTIKITYHRSCKATYTTKAGVVRAASKKKMIGLPLSLPTQNQNSDVFKNCPEVDSVDFDTRTQCFICSSSYECNEKLTSVSSCLRSSIQENVLKAAEERSDEKITIRMSAYPDLSAYDAKYHESCYASYISESNIQAAKSRHEVVENPYEKGFKLFCEEVEHYIFSDMKEVLLLSDMNTRFIEILCTVGEADPSSNKSWRLKEKLKDHFGDRIVFFSRSLKPDLVCSKSLSLGDLVMKAREMKAKGLHIKKGDDGNFELAFS